jgi:hypothetical protein
MVRIAHEYEVRDGHSSVAMAMKESNIGAFQSTMVAIAPMMMAPNATTMMVLAATIRQRRQRWRPRR